MIVYKTTNLVNGKIYVGKHNINNDDYLSSSHKGKTLSKEHKEKISDSITGDKNPFYNKKHSIETIEKLRKMSSGKNNPNFGVIGSTKSKKVNINNIEYKSISSASNLLNISRKIIKKKLNDPEDETYRIVTWIATITHVQLEILHWH